MEELYRKDLSHLTWDEVFARQGKRAGLVEEWMNDLQPKPGARVLDVGARLDGGDPTFSSETATI